MLSGIGTQKKNYFRHSSVICTTAKTQKVKYCMWCLIHACRDHMSEKYIHTSSDFVALHIIIT